MEHFNYFAWLCMWAVPDGQKRSDYSELLTALNNTEFTWTVNHDENRAADGIQLRTIYEDETGEWCDQGGPCSVLEMLLALSIRCDSEIMYDPYEPNRADKWFWMMIENLGMDIFVNGSFVQDGYNSAIFRFLGRKYGKSGQFCLFPIPEMSTKFQKIELIYQMNYYLKWRFPRFFE